MNTLIILVLHFVINSKCEQKDNFSYQLPVKIEERKAGNSNISTTVFGYNEQFDLLSITNFELASDHVYTAFISYTEDGLIKKIRQTSSNAYVSEKIYEFEYRNKNIVNIYIIQGSVRTHIPISYDQKHNSYFYKRLAQDWEFDLDENNNLEKIKVADTVATSIETNQEKGICYDISIQPALWLVHDQLEAINSLTIFLFNTNEINKVYYDEMDFFIQNEINEFGNIHKIIFDSKESSKSEFKITYETNDMRS